MLNRLHSFARHRNVLERVVDVWLVDPAALQDSARVQAGCLDDAERQRLGALRFERDRGLYLASHVFLRHVLSLYRPAVLPAQWHFDTAANGRPEVGGWAGERGSAAPPRLRFSLSHTEGLVAVAVTHDWDIGVDVERARADLDLAVMAPALLAGPEHKWFGLLPASARHSAFLGLWTMKEALLKARGLGIGEDLGSIALVHSWADPRAVITRSPRLVGQGCNVMMGRVAGGYSLGLAVLGPLASGPPASAPQRRLALFDLREPQLPPDGRTFANALFLPVRDAARAVARGRHTEPKETLNVQPQ